MPERRTLTLDTGRRHVDVPVDPHGHQRMTVTLDARSIERRAEGEPIGFTGHAAMFGKRTWIGPKRWGFFEQVASGAFTKTIKEADVRLLVNHNPDLLLARNKAGTLRLSEDKVGLATDADIAPTTYGHDLAVLLERGDISQMSFAFEVIKDTWEVLEDENELRTLQEVRLWDVSVVTYPAYEDTDAKLRNAANELLERLGVDDQQARRMAAALASGDADAEVSHLLRSMAERFTAAADRSSRSQPATATGSEPPSDAQPGDPTGALHTKLRRMRLSALERHAGAI